MEEVARALSENIKWGQRTSYTQPLPLLGTSKYPKIPKEYFFNRDLHFLVHGNTDPSKRYASSLTKIKAASYPIEELESQMRGLYAKTAQPYKHEAELGTLYWPELRRWFYKYKLSLKSKKKVFSEHRILAIKEITKMDSRYGYNFLDEILVRRHDDKEYTFSEADFHRLNLDDLFEM